MSNKRICIDLDGVIANLKKNGETYSDILPVEGAQEKLEALKRNGHYIIIQTARHMKTCEGNLGKVNARITKITLDWLEKHNIPYDEIYFGKPWAHLYIDDNAFRFRNWNSIEDDGSNLPEHNELKQASK
ncbi:MAG: capsular biosynthesis protein [Flavobacteriia bacterium]|nr:capsular biosynthesis protein [Flavobacteriia bacterium]OJX36922.1 MAG: capsular biosynthesis protein [Flavobacteriia bacterium 40-80]